MAKVTARLKYIEICNFKSFAGRHRVGPFLDFSVLVGPNGSGKSNMIDAICFVMGEKSSNLRVKKLKDLVHGAHAGRPALEQEIFVMAVFEEDKGIETSFTRAIHGGASVYKVNDIPTHTNEYLDRLRKMGVTIKSKNFFIYQDQIEALIMASARERTDLFEQMSRSIEFKDDYDKARKNMELCERDLSGLMKKKRIVFAEKRSAKLLLDGAKEYRQLCGKLEEEELRLRLFKLNQIEIELKEIENEAELQNDAKSVATEELDEAEEALKRMKREQQQANQKAWALENQLKKLDRKTTESETLYLRAKESMDHADMKLKTSVVGLASARKSADCHAKVVSELHEEFREVQRRKRSYIEWFEAQGGQMQLDDAQVAEHRRLKKQAAEATGHLFAELDLLELQQASDNAHLDNERRKRDDLIEQMEALQHYLDSREERIKKLDEYITSSYDELNKLRMEETKLASEVDAASCRMNELNEKKERIRSRKEEISYERWMLEIYEKKGELIDQLKRLFPGVRGRLVDCCDPIHGRYKVAVTKVIGRYLEAIICDSHLTATNCIRYLRDQCCKAETFLPLDFLKVKPIDEKLREIKEPKNVKLIFDVLSFKEPLVRPAILFACGDSLVCETVADAQWVAYNMGRKLQTVSLDGVLFQKNGLISGGTSELELRAKRWDKRESFQLKQEEKDNLDEINRVHRSLGKKSKLADLRSQIEGIRSRIRFVERDKSNVEKVDCPKTRQLARLEQQVNACDGKILEISNRVAQQDEVLNAKKEEVNGVEDEFFVQFCQDVGVDNVREYEERWLRMREQHDEKLLEFDTHLLRLENQMNFEESRTEEIRSNVEKRRKQVTDNEETVARLKVKEENLFKELTICREERAEVKNTLAATRTQASDMFTSISRYCQIELAEKRSAMGTILRMLLALDMKRARKKAERHIILKSFRFGNLSLPLVHGTLDDLVVEGDGEEDEEEEATGASTSSAVAPGIFSKEDLMDIDFGLLEDCRNVTDRDLASKLLEEMEDQVTSLQVKLERLPPPDLTSSVRFSKVTNDCKEVAKEFEAVRAQVRNCKAKFDKVRKKRHDLFMDFFGRVSRTIDDVYKSLSRNDGAQAVLVLENEEEPYLGGTFFNCMTPSKQFTSMDNMSGGEKAMAALTLLFTIHRCCSAPFLLLDEVDAALDNVNIHNVVSYIRDMSAETQCFIVSHKREFHGSANALYGFYIKKSDSHQMSNLLSLDLRRYVRGRMVPPPVAADDASVLSAFSDISSE